MMHFCHFCLHGLVSKHSSFAHTYIFFSLSASTSFLSSLLLSQAQSLCGLLLDEQSYYENPNPSLRDRGVRQDFKDSKTWFVHGNTNTKLENAHSMQMNIKKYVVLFICCIILLLQMDKSGRKQLNPHPSISEIQPILKCCCCLTPTS